MTDPELPVFPRDLVENQRSVNESRDLLEHTISIPAKRENKYTNVYLKTNTGHMKDLSFRTVVLHLSNSWDLYS